MFFSLREVPDHPLYQLKDAIEGFLRHCSIEETYEVTCFPDWFQKVLGRSPELRVDFEEVAEMIYALNPLERTTPLEIFQSVNDIESLCSDITILPLEFPPQMNALQERLKTLFKETLFDDVLKRGSLFKWGQDQSIRDHYKKFKHLNTVCPFCGIEEYKDRDSLPRNCYDHYLFEGKYFLAGINFKNIVPMCETCNAGGNKGSDDVLFDGAARREAFYPYESVNGVELQVECLEAPTIENQLGNWRVTIEPKVVADYEKVITWTTVFKLLTRLEARIGEKNSIWMDRFVRIRFQNDSCNEEKLRAALMKESEELKRKINTEREAVLESSYIFYMADKGESAQLIGFCGVAESEYTRVMSEIGAGLQ